MNLTNRPDLKLARVLQALFIAQARDVVARTSPQGEPPDLSNWTAVVERATKPLLLQMFRQGMLESAKRINNLQRGGSHGQQVSPQAQGQEAEAESQAVLAAAEDAAGGRVQEPMARWAPGLGPSRSPQKGWSLSRRPQILAVGEPGPAGGRHFVDFQRHAHRRRGLRRSWRKSLGFDFDLYDPRVDDAVDQAVLSFCKETNDTAKGSLSAALAKLREEMKVGLRAGEAHAVLAKRVQAIFADPLRAWRIAVTESSRALHLGGLMAARDSGVVDRKRWLASYDACKACLALNGKTVKLDEPFIILPKPPPYNVIMVPPLHPHDMCSWTEVLKKQK